jgi:hypothetical protein
MGEVAIHEPYFGHCLALVEGVRSETMGYFQHVAVAVVSLLLLVMACMEILLSL